MGWVCRGGRRWLVVILLIDLSLGSVAMIYLRAHDCIAVDNGVELRR
jgi:hypothetical protein